MYASDFIGIIPCSSLQDILHPGRSKLELLPLAQPSALPGKSSASMPQWRSQVKDGWLDKLTVIGFIICQTFGEKPCPEILTT
jgi:hypothetical protein